MGESIGTQYFVLGRKEKPEKSLVCVDLQIQVCLNIAEKTCFCI